MSIYKFAYICVLLTCLDSPAWHYNLQEAQQIAQREHRHILLNFSGSDWCGPCIMLRKEILDQPAFLQLADTELVLLNADFPRKKKDQLPAAQQQLNNAMADRYDPEGKFPFTLLLDARGKILEQWDGFPNTTPEAFGMEIKKVIDSDR